MLGKYRIQDSKSQPARAFWNQKLRATSLSRGNVTFKNNFSYDRQIHGEIYSNIRVVANSKISRYAFKQTCLLSPENGN